MSKEKEIYLRKYVYEVLRSHEGITLTSLHKELKSYVSGYSIGKTTLKRIIFHNPDVYVKIHPKKSPLDLDRLERCVVCKNKNLVGVYEVRLDGSRLMIGKKCSVCGFLHTSNIGGVRKYEIYLSKRQ